MTVSFSSNCLLRAFWLGILLSAWGQLAYGVDRVETFAPTFSIIDTFIDNINKENNSHIDQHKPAFTYTHSQTSRFFATECPINALNQDSDSTLHGFLMNENINVVTIPVKIIHNLVLLPIRINRSLPMDFILDTGVYSTILTEPAWADIIGLTYTSKANLRGLGGGDLIEANVASNVHFSLPQIEGRGVNLVVLPSDILTFSEMFGQSVDGIIGYDLFRAFTIEINYTEKYVRLYRPGHYRPNKKMTTLPITIYKGKPYIDAQLGDTIGKKYPVHLLLDTGASQSLSLFSDDSTVVPLATKTITTYIGKGLSGDVLGEIGYINNLTLAHFDLNRPLACYPDSAAMSLQAAEVPWQGSIGGELFHRFKVVFDYPKGLLYLKKNEHFASKFTYNQSGLEVLTMGAGAFDRFIVSHVRAGSCAEKLGILADDELLSINGISLQPLTISDVYGLLQKKSGRILRLKIRRLGVILHYKLSLTDELAE